MKVIKTALWLWLGIANAQSPTHDVQTSSSTPTSSSTTTTTFSPLTGSPTPFPPGKCFKSNRPKPSPSPSVPAQSPAKQQPKQQSLQKPQQQQQQSRSSSAQAMVGDADGCIALQNTARAEVGVPPMVWDRQLAATAQAWANHLYTYDLGMVHSSGQGQNLYKGTGECIGANIAWVVKEKPRYLPGAPIDEWGDFESYGHFTQIVFRSTNRAGCSIPHANGRYFVCHYMGQQISGSPAY